MIITQSKACSCYIITESTLGIQCAEEVLKEKWNLLGIVSLNKEVVNWAISKDISCISSIKKFEEICRTYPFDYLFTIVSSEIISSDIIALSKRYCINYHDSILPRYAGIHATSWAILNNEKQHGISWHIIEPKVDAGNILIQETFDIDPDDTALSLNIKCHTHALNTFKVLIKKLESGDTTSNTQNLTLRTYFALNKKPQNFGFTFWDSSAEDIYRQYRALNFGNYPNTLASFKILIDKQIYIPYSLEILPFKSSLNYGTITNITKFNIQISSATYDITISELYTMSGEKVTIQDVINNTGITVGQRLKNPSNELITFLQNYSKNISASEQFWLKTIIDIINPQVQFIKHINKNSNYVSLTTYTWKYPKNINDLQHIPIEIILITSFLIYLHKLGNNSFTVGYITSFLDSLSGTEKILFPLAIPMNCCFDLSLPTMEIVELVMHRINSLEKNLAYCQDIFIRYPLLTNSSFDLKIVIYEGDYRNIINHFTSDVLLFCIDIKNETYGLYSNSNYHVSNQIIIKNFPKHIEALTKQITRYEKNNLKQFYMLTLEEEELLNKWNQTDKEFPYDKTIHKLFEEQVSRTPNNTAVVYEDISLTYTQLNYRTNQLAHYLIQQYNVEPDSLIALFLDRSENIIIAILAILKSGAAYVPIDPNYPDERVQYILEDTRVKVVLTNAVYQSRLLNLIIDNKKKCKTPTEVRAIDSSSLQSELSLRPTKNPITKTKSTNLAYVIYTSGTTGVPKGVLIEHMGIVNLLFQNALQDILKHVKRGTLWTNIVFDVSVYEIFSILLTGAGLHILSSLVRGDASNMLQYLSTHKINSSYLPPYFLHIFKESYSTELELVLSGVDKIRVSDVVDLCNSSNKVKILNGYGPTEATVFCTGCFYSKDSWYPDIMPIGRPIANTKVYVLDSNLKLLPIGAVGELYIGGIGLARGYLNKPDLTLERFISNPFQTLAEKQNKIYGDKGHNARIYKTGDLVRWLPDGNLEYIGRNDSQVKIRGYRVELGEIESILSQYPGIKQSVVIAKDSLNKEDQSVSGSQYLVGYYVSDRGLDEEELTKYLSFKLPDYMIPTILIHITKLPLTINGKLDRNALPEPELKNIFGNNYVAPRDALETKLCDIWGQVLGIDSKKIGVYDNFFKLGGNSLRLLSLFVKIKSLYPNLNKNLKEFLLSATVEHLANLINNASNTSSIYQYSVNDILSYELSLVHELSRKLPSDSFQSYGIDNVVFLTGATGFLGAHLLHELLNTETKEIYCLVRAQTIAEGYTKLRKNYYKYFPNSIIPYNRIRVIIGDLSKNLLNIPTDVYQEVCNNCNVIIHNASRVNHLEDYQKLRAENVLGTFEIIKLATTSRKKQLYYISSISAISNKGYNCELYETFSRNMPSFNIGGYNLTKWVSERLLEEISNKIPIFIFRPSIISGNSNDGVVNSEDNHFLHLLKYCVEVCRAPYLNQQIDLLPADFIAKFIVKTVVYGSEFRIFNLITQNKVEWLKIIHCLNRFGYNIKIIPIIEWMKNLDVYLTTKNAFSRFVPLYEEGINFPELHSIMSNNFLQQIKYLNLLLPQINEDFFQKNLQFLIKTRFIKDVYLKSDVIP